MPLDDQEEWRDIEGIQGYRVSNHGRVASFRRRHAPFAGATFDKWIWEIDYSRPRIMAATKSPKGYHMVPLRKGGRFRLQFVHVLVLEAFVGPRPEGEQGRHLNDDKSNNTLANLAWGTQSVNMCERYVNSKTAIFALTPNDVMAIRDCLAQGQAQSFIARQFNITQSLVSRIKTGKRWAYV